MPHDRVWDNASLGFFSGRQPLIWFACLLSQHLHINATACQCNDVTMYAIVFQTTLYQLSASLRLQEILTYDVHLYMKDDTFMWTLDPDISKLLKISQQKNTPFMLQNTFFSSNRAHFSITHKSELANMYMYAYESYENITYCQSECHTNLGSRSPFTCI